MYNFNYNYKQEDLSYINSMIVNAIIDYNDNNIEIFRYGGTVDYIAFDDEKSSFEESNPLSINFIENKPTVVNVQSIQDYSLQQGNNSDIVIVGNGSYKEKYANVNGVLRRIDIKKSDYSGRILMKEFVNDMFVSEDSILVSTDGSMYHALNTFTSDALSSVTGNVEKYNQAYLFYQVEEIVAYGMIAHVITSLFGSKLKIRDKSEYAAIIDWENTPISKSFFWGNTLNIFDSSGYIDKLYVGYMWNTNSQNDFFLLDLFSATNPTEIYADFESENHDYAGENGTQYYGIQIINKSDGSIIAQDVIEYNNSVYTRKKKEANGALVSTLVSVGINRLSIGDISLLDEVSVKILYGCNSIKNLTVKYSQNIGGGN